MKGQWWLSRLKGTIYLCQTPTTSRARTPPWPSGCTGWSPTSPHPTSSKASMEVCFSLNFTFIVYFHHTTLTFNNELRFLRTWNHCRNSSIQASTRWRTVLPDRSLAPACTDISLCCSSIREEESRWTFLWPILDSNKNIMLFPGPKDGLARKVQSEEVHGEAQPRWDLISISRDANNQAWTFKLNLFIFTYSGVLRNFLLAERKIVRREWTYFSDVYPLPRCNTQE